MELVTIFLCRPIRTLWDPSVKNAHCLNQRKVFFASIALAIVTDVIILFIPIPLVYRLERSVQERIKVLLLLAIGGIATAATCFRAKLVAEFLNSNDITVDYTRIGILRYVSVQINTANGYESK